MGWCWCFPAPALLHDILLAMLVGAMPQSCWCEWPWALFLAVGGGKFPNPRASGGILACGDLNHIPRGHWGLVEGYKAAPGSGDLGSGHNGSMAMGAVWAVFPLGNPSALLHPLSFLLGETTLQCCAKHRNKSPGNGDAALGFSCSSSLLRGKAMVPPFISPGGRILHGR